MAVESDLETLRACVRGELAARLPAHAKRLERDAGQLVTHQLGCLRALLGHAIEHSRFHARRLRGVDEVTVRTVEAIERNPGTGKARRFIPLRGTHGLNVPIPRKPDVLLGP